MTEFQNKMQKKRAGFGQSFKEFSVSCETARRGVQMDPNIHIIDTSAAVGSIL